MGVVVEVRELRRARAHVQGYKYVPFGPVEYVMPYLIRCERCATAALVAVHPRMTAVARLMVGGVSCEELGRAVCRRAQENSDMMGGVGHEMRLLRGDHRRTPVPCTEFTAPCSALVLQPDSPSRLDLHFVQAPCI